MSPGSHSSSRSPSAPGVAVTSSSDTKLARVRALGAAETINYRAHSDLVKRVLEWRGPDGVDHVIETIGGDNLNLSLQAVEACGTVSFIGLIAGQTANVNTHDFVTKNVTIHGIETGSREMFEELAAFIDEHGLKPVIDSTLPVDEVVSALAHLRSGRHFGRILLHAVAPSRLPGSVVDAHPRTGGGTMLPG